MEKTLAEQIIEKQTELVASRDILVDLSSKLDDSQESQKAVVEATANVEKATQELDTLKSAEAAISKSLARNTSASIINADPSSRITKENKEDLFFKSALCTFEAYVKRVPLQHIVEARFGDDEVVKTITGIMQKTAQPIAASNVAGWAQELTRQTYGAFLDILRGESVVPQVPMNTYSFDGFSSIIIPARNGATPNLAGAFRAEGAPIPVKGLALTSQTLTPKNMGVISTFTNELFERSTPNILSLIRTAMIEDTSVAIDTAYLSATAGSATVPAGLQTYATGANTAASAGATSANIITDVRGRIQQMLSKNMGRRAVWIMHPSRWLGVSMSVNATGMLTFPDTANGTLAGYQVITSTNVDPALVYLVDGAEIGFAGGMPRFMGTDIATLHEETAPTALSTVGTPNAVAAPIRSLYQTNSAALRCMWDLDWKALRPDGSVQLLTAVAW